MVKCTYIVRLHTYTVFGNSRTLYGDEPIHCTEIASYVVSWSVRTLYVATHTYVCLKCREKEPSVVSDQKISKTYLEIAVLRLFLTACGNLIFLVQTPGRQGPKSAIHCMGESLIHCLGESLIHCIVCGSLLYILCMRSGDPRANYAWTPASPKVRKYR